MTRFVVLVLDGLGVGELPDASAYGDSGSDTLGNTSRAVGGLKVPNLVAMGLGLTSRADGVPPAVPSGAAGRLAERSPGKDTLTGHWELAGLVTRDPIPTYPEGFPAEMLRPFEEAIGGPVLGNKVASGTAIIEELGEEHLRTGRPIVYTSADSVFQIAAHEDVVPLEDLYRMCEIARELSRHPPYLVGRVIARPFAGRPGEFRRTAGRHDYSLPPPGRTLLEAFVEAGMPVVAVGKVKDIFAGRGVTRHVPALGNQEVMQAVITEAGSLRGGLVIGNLVDFDMLYGHRNDPPGFARALEGFDRRLPELKDAALGNPAGGLLVLTADHGCDPTTPSTDHSREYVPILAEGRAPATGATAGSETLFRRGVDLGVRESFADLAATVAELAGLAEYGGAGRSFAGRLTGGTAREKEVDPGGGLS
ncbi:MAG: phosphopentomutase [Bacillota bacterium]|nr:MAG: phosphopentomutase [Bacillota bacterium]